MSPKGPCVRSLVPSLVLSEGGGNSEKGPRGRSWVTENMPYIPKGTLRPCPLPLLCFLVTMKWAPKIYCILLPWCPVLPQSTGHGAYQQWTKTSEAHPSTFLAACWLCRGSRRQLLRMLRGGRVLSVKMNTTPRTSTNPGPWREKVGS